MISGGLRRKQRSTYFKARRVSTIIANREIRHEAKKHRPHTAMSCHLDVDGRRVAIPFFDGAVRLYDLTGTETGAQPTPAPSPKPKLKPKAKDKAKS